MAGQLRRDSGQPFADRTNLRQSLAWAEPFETGEEWKLRITSASAPLPEEPASAVRCGAQPCENVVPEDRAKHGSLYCSYRCRDRLAKRRQRLAKITEENASELAFATLSAQSRAQFESELDDDDRPAYYKGVQTRECVRYSLEIDARKGIQTWDITRREI